MAPCQAGEYGKKVKRDCAVNDRTATDTHCTRKKSCDAIQMLMGKKGWEVPPKEGKGAVLRPPPS